MTSAPSSAFGPGRALGVYAVTLVIFFAIDLVWLGVVAKNFYRQHIGHLLSANVNWAAAVLFYLVYIAGIVVFAVRPAIDAGSAARAVTLGALLGFLAYATYDLTNQATMRDWPTPMARSLPRRRPGSSQRTSGCRAATMASFLQASTANPAKPSIISSEIAQGPIVPRRPPGHRGRHVRPHRH